MQNTGYLKPDRLQNISEHVESELLDKDFSDEKLLLDNINHKDKEIRYLSVVNLAKLSNLNFLSIVKSFFFSFDYICMSLFFLSD